MPTSPESLFLHGSFQGDDTQEECGETITEILCRISYPFVMFYNGYYIAIHVYKV